LNKRISGMKDPANRRRKGEGAGRPLSIQKRVERTKNFEKQGANSSEGQTILIQQNWREKSMAGGRDRKREKKFHLKRRL